ncbi:HlyD family secretion protein [Methylobacterium crusticola]|nr:HlyD family secretion protein [Methylobacterium crusticola]
MAFREDYAQGRPAAPAAAAAAPVAAPAAARSPAEAAPPARRRVLRRLVVATLLLGAAAFGAFEGADWYKVGRFFVATDDAYVQADISTLAAKVSGYLDAVPVVNGQAVRAGDVIARIEDGDYRLALQAAEDKLATQRSTIVRIGRQVEAARAQVLQGGAQIEAAKADQVRAAADYQRQMQLAQSEFAARSRLEQARADRDRQDATVKGAEANLTALQANVAVLEAQGREAENLAAELKTAADRARRDLSFTVLRAPFDGVIGNKAVEAGAYVAPGSRIAALVPLQSARVDANFKETQLARVRVGQPVHIRVDAWPDRDIQGTVESLSPASGSVFSLLPPDNATGNFTKIVQRLPVRVRVPEAVAREGLLRPGLSVVVRVDTRGLRDDQPPAPIAPLPAVSEGAPAVRTAGRR